MSMDPRMFGGSGSAASTPNPPPTEEDEVLDVDASNDPYDFTNATCSSSFPSLDASPDFKMFFLDVVLKEGKVSRTVPIRIAKREVGKLYEKISKMLLLEMGGFDVVYSVRRQSGKRQEQRLQFHSDADIMGEGCELLYCQVRTESHITIQRITKQKEVKKIPRKATPQEKSCTAFKGLMGTKNSQAYRMLAENPAVVTKYLSKLDYVRVLLNDETCNNWLSPAHFYCPLRTCSQKEIVMNNFNSAHNLQKHLVNHDLNKNKMCSVLIDRMKFLDKDAWFDENQRKGVAWMIGVLDRNPELSLRPYEVVTVHFGNEFKGSSKCLDPAILEEMLRNNFKPLKKIKDAPTVSSLLDAEGDDESSESSESDDDDLDQQDNNRDKKATDDVISSDSDEEIGVEKEKEVVVAGNNSSDKDN